MGRFARSIDGMQVRQALKLAPGEAKTVTFSPETYSELKLAHPRLWWPYQMGEPNLYTAKLEFDIDGQVSDSADVTFGIREATSELTDKGYRLFKINGRKVLIRGAAWAPDMFLRWSPERVDADFAYVRDMGLEHGAPRGTNRSRGIFHEGGPARDSAHAGVDLLRRLGAMEELEGRAAQNRGRFVAQPNSDLAQSPQRLRVAVWQRQSSARGRGENVSRYFEGLGLAESFGIFGRGDADHRYGKVGRENDRPIRVRSAGLLARGYDKRAELTAITRKPVQGRQYLRRNPWSDLFPQQHLWPIDDVWNYHAGGERFTTVNVFTDALNRRYGTATSLDDYERKAQAMTYDGQRAMFEAYARNKYTSTGVIQWMLNNAWPSLIWHLYDYYMVPAGGYFGTKKATELVHVQYSYDDNSVAVINGTNEAVKGAKVTAKLYNIDAKEKGSRAAMLDLAPDSSTKAFDLPKIDDLTKTYFLRLELHDPSGKLLSDNFYWLSTKPDTLDWKHKQDTVYTPQAEFGDLTGLNSLPPAKIIVSQQALGKAGSKQYDDAYD